MHCKRETSNNFSIFQTFVIHDEKNILHNRGNSFIIFPTIADLLDVDCISHLQGKLLLSLADKIPLH